MRASPFATIIRPAAAGVAMAVCAGLAACGGGGGPHGPVSLDRDVRPLLTRSCTFATTCHGTADAAGHIQWGPPDAVPGDALVAMVAGVPSTIAPAVARVTPGDSSGSFLTHKLTGDFAGLPCAPAACGARMPMTGDPLPPAEIATIASWIDGGALAN